MHTITKTRALGPSTVIDPAEPLKVVFPPWQDLPEVQRAIVRAAAESIARQAQARRMAGRPPKVLRPGSEAHWKHAMVLHYLDDLRAEGGR